MPSPRALPVCLLLGAGAAVALLQGCGGGSSSSTPKKPAGTTIAVGSGGCDDQDTNCKDDKSAEHVIKFLTLSDDGELHDWTNFSGLQGNAAWFAVTESCMFVTYPDASTVEAYQRNGDSLPVSKQTAIKTGRGDEGSNPVYADVSKDGKFLIVANYHGPDNSTNSKGASVQTFSISGDCQLKEADFVRHNGSSKKPERQGAAHPHSAVVGKDGKVFVCDLGMDMIFTYNIDASGKLKQLATTRTNPGSGPRHSMQHPKKDLLFVVSEMGSNVTSYNIEKTGSLTKVAEISALTGLEEEHGYGSKTAELAITPDGKHLYASNRAFDPKFNNTIAVFDIMDDGNMTFAQQVDSPPFPRGMVLMPDGKYLLVASQTNGNVTSFKVEPTGLLTREAISTQKGPWGAAAFAILGTKSTKSEATNKVVV